MTEQLISLDTARLAKEKGFLGKTVSFYRTDDGSLRENSERVPIAYHIIEHSVAIAAPTQSLLQRWLREVHGITIWLRPWEEYWEYTVELSESDEIYDTYEEALEQGLQEALKLI